MGLDLDLWLEDFLGLGVVLIGGLVVGFLEGGLDDLHSFFGGAFGTRHRDLLFDLQLLHTFLHGIRWFFLLLPHRDLRDLHLRIIRYVNVRDIRSGAVLGVELRLMDLEALRPALGLELTLCESFVGTHVNNVIIFYVSSFIF